MIKKIRNSLYSSGREQDHKRLISHPFSFIEWAHFRDAYMWDNANHTLRIHRKLTSEHFYLNNALKMRNHLAEQVLNSDMLLLMQQNAKSLPDGNILKHCIELLNHTSKLIDIFRSPLSITSTHDDRRATLLSCRQIFENWCSFCENQMTKGQNNFITKECFTDIMYCINGFSRLCEIYCEEHPIQPSLINSDVIENNIFRTKYKPRCYTIQVHV